MMKAIFHIKFIFCVFGGLAYALQSDDAVEISDFQRLLKRFAEVRGKRPDGKPPGKAVGRPAETPKVNSLELQVEKKCISEIRKFMNGQDEDACALDVTSSVVRCVLGVYRKVVEDGADIGQAAEEFGATLTCGGGEEEEEEEEEREEEAGNQFDARRRKFWSKLVKGLKIAAKVIRVIWGNR